MNLSDISIDGTEYRNSSVTDLDTTNSGGIESEEHQQVHRCKTLTAIQNLLSIEDHLKKMETGKKCLSRGISRRKLCP